MTDAAGFEVVSVADLGRRSLPAGPVLDRAGASTTPVVFVSLDHKVHDWEVDAALRQVGATPDVLTVGVSRRVVAPGLDRLAETLTCTIGDGEPSSATALVPDLDATMRTIAATIAHAPRAAIALDALLRVTERSGMGAGLVAESLAHSTLRAGPEFARWRANNPVRPHEPIGEPAVVVERDGLHLVVELNRPQRQNTFDRELRDGLIEALELALGDRTISQVIVRGRGRSFCGGGDPGEFSDTPDPHQARPTGLDRSVGARLDRLRARVTVEVHGACVGAGAELPAFAGRVVARRDSFFQLPQLSMGLLPGAGGTVSITRRIGRPRTAYLALTGARIDAATALGWGLVDTLA